MKKLLLTLVIATTAIFAAVPKQIVHICQMAYEKDVRTGISEPLAKHGIYYKFIENGNYINMVDPNGRIFEAKFISYDKNEEGVPYKLFTAVTGSIIVVYSNYNNGVRVAGGNTVYDFINCNNLTN